MSRVKRIALLPFHLNLEPFGSLGEASSDFIIETGRVIGKTVYLVVYSLFETIVDTVEDRQIVHESTSLLLMAANGRTTSRSGVSCSMVAVVSHIPR